MKHLSLLIVLLILLCVARPLAALNQMEMLTNMTGEFHGSKFGSSLVSMDYNGDGYDDLIVHSLGWNPDGVYGEYDGNCWGKTYCYWGGPGFDNIADLTFSGTHLNGYNGPLHNAGDVNGDGYDDLLAYNYGNWTTVGIFFGGPTPSVVPDILITKPGNVLHTLGAYPLGDINGDGKADLALHAEVHVSRYSQTALYIWTGEDQEWHEVLSYVNRNLLFPYGVGDVNNDGIDDYGILYGIRGGEWSDRRIVLYYGSQSYPQLDSLVIAENTNPDLGGSGFSPVGDVNGDGIDDFITWESKIWYGGDSLGVNPDLSLEFYTEWHDWSSMGNNKIPHCAYGDLNGDGYDDVIGSHYGVNYWSGEVAIWLGSANMDPICDIYLRPPYLHNTRQFGWDKAAGDFNADGLCDLAISAPEYYGAPAYDEGHVFVYSGNPDLVSNEDPLTPQLTDKLRMNISPNPLCGNREMSVTLTGLSKDSADPIHIEIYNLKGQLIHESLIASMLSDELISTLSIGNQPSGIYFCRARNSRLSTTRRFAILK